MEKDKVNKLAVKFTVGKAEGDGLPHGVIEAIIATEDLDRHNEHMKISGIETPRKNYKVYYNHSYHGSKDLPIGIIEKLTKKSGQLIGRLKLAVNEYDFAEQVYKLVQGGFIDSMSIGFIPKEWDENSQTWTRSEFVEASLVAEPANVEALVTSKGLSQEDAKAFIDAEKKFADEVAEKSADKVKAITADLDGLSLTELKTVLNNAKQSIGELEALANKAEQTTSPTAHTKTLIKLRIAGKGLDRHAEQVNKAIKIKLRVKTPRSE
jgi:HK97 family phage prohead protease